MYMKVKNNPSLSEGVFGCAQGLAKLTRVIFARAQPKRLGSQTITGAMLAALAEAYVSAINRGAVPTIATAWQVAIPRCISHCFVCLTSCTSTARNGCWVRACSMQTPVWPLVPDQAVSRQCWVADQCRGKQHAPGWTSGVWPVRDKRLQGVAEAECRRAADAAEAAYRGAFNRGVPAEESRLDAEHARCMALAAAAFAEVAVGEPAVRGVW